ncbi:hypothetical protein [Haladaptatus sp. DJG-WS-42]|uniref:hypothetical protein n=1 Tax=Haladaptatus sp. DJG-WS-42 TaxID=3120516 RepID=UPI0030CDC784
MEQPSRRALLSTIVVGLAPIGSGCVDGQSPGTPTDSETTQSTPPPTASPTERKTTLSLGETATSSDGVTVTISEPQVRKIIYTPDVGGGTHKRPAGETNAQFLGFDVETAETEISSLEFTPVLDGTRTESKVYRTDFVPGQSTRLSLLVPVQAVESGAIEWTVSADEQYRWTLPDAVLTKLAKSPEFETEFSVPESIPRGDSFTASIDVTNTGDRDGRFLAVVLDQGAGSLPLVPKFTFPVSIGETVSRELSGEAVRTDSSEMTAIFDWGLERQTASFAVTD